ncbi:Flp pilus assembly protein CpaB [Thiomicrospira pelophila]|uniref:Flp pilus assembly protein CpaB n=1 Tax=Thiomicrospira pelophila TaxID=934 RepID=UPI0004A70008|nr:Flp pilus assembly protein CpaB [Thiomicrospira pelophila]
MKAKKSDLVLYGVAFISAMLAILLVYGYVQSRVDQASQQVAVKTVTVVEKPELRSVVVASRDLYRGERIEVEDITVLNVPTEGVVLKGVIVDPQAVVGHVLNQTVYAGEWIIDRKIGSDESQSNTGMGSLLDEGRRAVRIPVSPESGLIGLLRPSDHVDVIGVFESADGSRMISRTVLENIEVLMVGDQANYSRSENKKSDEKSASSQGRSMVTLNVDTNQAEQLALAVNVGTVHLALRNATDVALVNSNGVNVKVMESSPQHRPVYTPKPKREVIEIMQGGQVQEVIRK